MVIRDIISQALDGKMTYPEAVSKLKELKLPPEEEESYEIILYKILGDEGSLVHRPLKLLNAIPNDMYYEILGDCIKMVRDGMFTPDICQTLYDKYAVSAPLMNYFCNESISIVRMNTLRPEEISAIGSAYHKVAMTLMKNGAINAIPKIEGVEEINAEQFGDIDLDDDYYDDDDN
jgi:hypothetical protein